MRGTPADVVNLFLAVLCFGLGLYAIFLTL